METTKPAEANDVRDPADAGLFDATAIGKLIGRSATTVKRWRQMGVTPKPVKIGAGYVWTKADLPAFRRLAMRLDEKRAPLVTIPKPKDGEA